MGNLSGESCEQNRKGKVNRFRSITYATTSCKNVETLPRKKQPFLLQIAPGHRSVRYNTDLPPPSHSKLFL